MKTALIDQDHTIAIDNGTLVLRSMNSVPVRTLVLEAFNKTKAEEVQLHLGETFRWDIETDEAAQENFDEVLFDMLDDSEFVFEDGGTKTIRVKLIALN